VLASTRRRHTSSSGRRLQRLPSAKWREPDLPVQLFSSSHQCGSSFLGQPSIQSIHADDAAGRPNVSYFSSS
jgi:hypothetical protein